ncbi:MAG: hypothetical protein ABII76_25455 [Pseudomonadota bacterium]
MVRMDTLKIAAVGGKAIYTFDKFPEKRQARGILLKIAITVTWASGPTTPADDDFKALLEHIFSSFTLKYGFEGRKHVPYLAANGGQLRNVCRVLTGNEPPNTFQGSAHADGDEVIYVFMPILFDAPLFRGKKRFPGTAQMRTMEVAFTEGSSATIITSKCSRKTGTDMTVDVLPLTIPGPDQWSSLLSLHYLTSDRLVARDEMMALPVAVWDENAAAASSQLTSINLDVGSERIHEEQSAADIYRATALLNDPGAEAIADEVTPLYTLPPLSVLEQAPHGQVTLKQTSSQVTTLKIAAIGWPQIEPEEADEGTRAGAEEKRTAVQGTTIDAGEDVHPGASSTLPIRFLTEAKKGFAVLPGLVAVPGSRVVKASLPAPVQAATTAAIASAADDRTKAQVSKGAIAAQLARMPGAVGKDGGAQGTAADEVKRVYRKL